MPGSNPGWCIPSKKGDSMWPFKKKESVLFVPRFTESDFGFSPRKKEDEDGNTLIMCDACKKFLPYMEVSVSPGDGYAECDNCI